MNQEEPIKWDEYLVAFTSGIGSKHPSICDSAYLSQKIFGLIMPQDFKSYGRGGIRSDMLCRDLALLWFAVRGENVKKSGCKYQDVFKVGKLLSNYDPTVLRSVASYLWNGNKGGNDLTTEEIKASKKIIKELKKARKTLQP